VIGSSHLKREGGLSHHSQPAFRKEEDEKVAVAGQRGLNWDKVRDLTDGKICSTLPRANSA
jgi:hypothetical protein